MTHRSVVAHRRQEKLDGPRLENEGARQPNQPKSPGTGATGSATNFNCGGAECSQKADREEAAHEVRSRKLVLSPGAMLPLCSQLG